MVGSARLVVLAGVSLAGPAVLAGVPAGAAGDYTFKQAVNVYAPSFMLREPRKTFRFTVATTF